MVEPKLGDELVGRDHTYTLQRRLGGGRYGEVWRATDENGLEVAVKVMLDGLDTMDQVRFRNEVLTLQLLHAEGTRARSAREGSPEPFWSADLPHVPRILDQSQKNAEPAFFAQSLAPGYPLDELLRGETALHELDAIEIMRQLCEVFSSLHTGVNRSYLDFQPRNVFWNPATRHIMVIDWNLLSHEGKADIQSDLAHLTRLLQRVLAGRPTDSGAIPPERWNALSLAAQNLLKLTPAQLTSALDLRNALREVEHWWTEEIIQLLPEASGWIDEGAQDPPDLARRRARIDGLLSVVALREAEAAEFRPMIAHLQKDASIQLPVTWRERLQAAVAKSSAQDLQALLNDANAVTQPDDKLLLMRWRSALVGAESGGPLPAALEAIQGAIDALAQAPLWLGRSDPPPDPPTGLPNSLTTEWQAWRSLTLAQQSPYAASARPAASATVSEQLRDAKKTAEVARKCLEEAELAYTALDAGLQDLLKRLYPTHWFNGGTAAVLLKARIAALESTLRNLADIEAEPEKDTKQKLICVFLGKAKDPSEVSRWTSIALEFGEANRAKNPQVVIDLCDSLLKDRAPAKLEGATDCLADPNQLDAVYQLRADAYRDQRRKRQEERDREIEVGAKNLENETLGKALEAGKAKLKLTAPIDDLQPPTLDEFNEGLAALKVLYESGTPQIKAAVPGLVTAALSRWLVDANALTSAKDWLPLDNATLNSVKKEIEQRTANWKLVDAGTLLLGRFNEHIRATKAILEQQDPAVWDTAEIPMKQAEALLLQMRDPESARPILIEQRDQLETRRRALQEAQARVQEAEALLTHKLIANGARAAENYRLAAELIRPYLSTRATNWQDKAKKVERDCQVAQGDVEQMQATLRRRDWAAASVILRRFSEAGWMGQREPRDLETQVLASYDAVATAQREWLAKNTPPRTQAEYPVELVGLYAKGDWVAALDTRRKAFRADVDAWYERYTNVVVDPTSARIDEKPRSGQRPLESQIATGVSAGANPDSKETQILPTLEPDAAVRTGHGESGQVASSGGNPRVPLAGTSDPLTTQVWSPIRPEAINPGREAARTFDDCYEKLEKILLDFPDANKWKEADSLHTALQSTLNSWPAAPREAKGALDRIAKLKEWYGWAINVLQCRKAPNTSESFQKAQSRLEITYSYLDSMYTGRDQLRKQHRDLMNMRYGLNW